MSDNSTVLALTVGEASPTHELPLRARFTKGGVPVLQVAVVAIVVGPDDTPDSTVLLDNSAHGDGPAGDGTYGARTNPLACDEYVVVVRAEAGDITCFTTDGVSIGIASSPQPQPPQPQLDFDDPSSAATDPAFHKVWASTDVAVQQDEPQLGVGTRPGQNDGGSLCPESWQAVGSGVLR